MCNSMHLVNFRLLSVHNNDVLVSQNFQGENPTNEKYQTIAISAATNLVVFLEVTTTAA